MADTAALAPFLEVFPDWLRTLGEDARELGESLDDADAATARYTVGGLNYIFKSLDLIPDGIDDLGFCDDAFVIRVAARLALAAEPAEVAEAEAPVAAAADAPAEADAPAGAPAEDPVEAEEPEVPAVEQPGALPQPVDAKESSAVLTRLAGDAAQVEAFLGEDYALLVTYVNGLRKGAARGRTVEDILGDEEVRTTFLQEVKAWATDYQVPIFTKDVKTLIKLKAFLSAKLG